MLLNCGVGKDSWESLGLQSILKEISPEYSLEGLILKLKPQYFGPPNVKHWLIGKEPDAGKDWRQKEKGTREDEMVGWHHRLKGHEFEQVLGVGDGQWGLACYSPWGCKESDTTEQLNWFNEYSKVVGYTQISLAFLYTNNWKTEKLRQADSILLSHRAIMWVKVRYSVWLEWTSFCWGLGSRAVGRKELKMIKILSLGAWEKMLLMWRWKQGNRDSLKKQIWWVTVEVGWLAQFDLC